MREELMLLIEKEYSFMQRESLAERNLYKDYGIDTSDGWFSIIWGMCEEIRQAYSNEGILIDFVPVQIKEKFGKLRVYYNLAGEQKLLHAIDILGHGTIRLENEHTEFSKKIASIVSKWESKSTSVCEKCGSPGELRTDLPWTLTLCNDCYTERKKHFI